MNERREDPPHQSLHRKDPSHQGFQIDVDMEICSDDELVW